MTTPKIKKEHKIDKVNWLFISYLWFDEVADEWAWGYRVFKKQEEADKFLKQYEVSDMYKNFKLIVIER
jgi:hypothetical protein